MVNYYDELEIEDFAWDPVARVFHYPCPCGDRFEISRAQLRDGEEIATCPSCSLIVRVIYDYLDWEDYATTDEEDDDEGEEDGSAQGDEQVIEQAPVSEAPAAVAVGTQKGSNGQPGEGVRDDKVDQKPPETAVSSTAKSTARQTSTPAAELVDHLEAMRLTTK